MGEEDASFKIWYALQEIRRVNPDKCIIILAPGWAQDEIPEEWALHDIAINFYDHTRVEYGNSVYIYTENSVDDPEVNPVEILDIGEKPTEESVF